MEREDPKNISKNEKSELYQSWIEACLEEATKPLSVWEREFLISVQDQLNLKGFLSEKQVEIIERIYVEKV